MTKQNLQSLTKLGVLLFVAVVQTLEAGEGEPYFEHTWQEAKRMPSARSEITSTAIDGKIYVVGGVCPLGARRSFEAYDVRANRWERLPNVPMPINHCGMAHHGRTIYISGGFTNMIETKYTERLYAYDIDQRKWTDKGPLPGNRAKHCMIFRDGWLHLIGGVNFAESWSYRLSDGYWSKTMIPPVPEKRDHFNLLQDGDHLYIVGGRRNREGARGSCWKFKFGTYHWETFTQLPQARSGQTAMLLDGKIHVVGGELLKTLTCYARYDIYDLATGKWRVGPPLNSVRHGMASSVVGNKWVVIGGAPKAFKMTILTAFAKVEVLDLW